MNMRLARPARAGRPQRRRRARHIADDGRRSHRRDDAPRARWSVDAAVRAACPLLARRAAARSGTRRSATAARSAAAVAHADPAAELPAWRSRWTPSSSSPAPAGAARSRRATSSSGLLHDGARARRAAGRGRGPDVAGAHRLGVRGARAPPRRLRLVGGAAAVDRCATGRSSRAAHRARRRRPTGRSRRATAEAALHGRPRRPTSGRRARRRPLGAGDRRRRARRAVRQPRRRRARPARPAPRPRRAGGEQHVTDAVAITLEVNGAEPYGRGRAADCCWPTSSARTSG